MDKHTPGPWTWFRDSLWNDDIEKSILGVASDALSRDVVNGFSDSDGWAPSDGDKALIAAAPAMFAEIEREYEELANVRNEWPGRYTPAGQAKLCRLRDLIASATGRSAKDVQDDYGNRAVARSYIAKATGASA